MTWQGTPILIAMGWLLLLPPAGQGGANPLIGQWQHAGSFDSAQACEAARRELIAAAQRRLGDPWAVPDLGDRGPMGPAISWTDSRCQQSDPRTGPRDP